MTPNKQSCSLVGGTPEERLTIAIRLRRLGVECFTEFKNRKRDKMFKKACEENYWGSAGVYDLDDPEDYAVLNCDSLSAADI